MNRKTLTDLFAGTLYRIPDYQRGFAWEKKQWNDFIQDIDAVIEDKVSGHYTGTVVAYHPRNATPQPYGTKRLQVVDVVDGQQRLTTSCLYLSVIIRELINRGEREYEREIPDFLYAGPTCKLTLSNDTSGTFYDLMKSGQANTEPNSPHEKRLIAAQELFTTHIEQQTVIHGAKEIDYLKDLYHAITQQLHFTYYEIEEEHEIGMTFELMNSRGKGLSVLELLKNYLMHWVSRNGGDENERRDLTALINNNWKDTYSNLGHCDGDEDQCLRIAWTLYCTHTPKYWAGYEGFKSDKFIPLRNFSDKRTRDETRDFIRLFADGLTEVSRYYATIMKPSMDSQISPEELLWMTKIHRAGNVANFLPLLVAAKRTSAKSPDSVNDFTELLKALEIYAYRVFLFEGKRSNAGKSAFYRMADQLFREEQTLVDLITEVHSLTRYYAPEEDFINRLSEPDDWYFTRHRLKYTLYEYELHSLSTEGKGKKPYLNWTDLGDSTIEHIMPRTPELGSHWLEVWNNDDISECLHDIGNLVLTQDNSAYSNFEYSRKKGKAGQSPSYSNSDIRQERKLAVFQDWTRETFDQRRSEIVEWITGRWQTLQTEGTEPLDITDEADEDATEGAGT